ncbi:MAG: von Willebrand factor type A domain-containing protein [Bacteroidia bacterium]
MINYFDYIYPQPTGEHPFSITAEATACTWAPEHQLVLIGLQGRELDKSKMPPNNLVFLVDVSGSMNSPDKLPLLQQSLNMLVEQMRPEDNIALVAYAGAPGLVLPSTSGSNKQKIKDAINALQSGGSTAGGAGIQLAYKVAQENFLKEGNNRIILCTDGDFNVGMSSDDELIRLIEEKRKSGVFLSVLGFGTGNYQDAKMENLADNGNGNFYYIDQLLEAQKVLVKEMGGTMFTIAKDVKIQVEFNPTKVESYRLIGYENRVMQAEDFNNDKKDAGELGSGHSVTALYEIIPAKSSKATKPESDLHFTQPTLTADAKTDQLLWVKFRYKAPQDSVSKLIEKPLNARSIQAANASENLRWAAAVAGFGMLLRNSKFKGDLSYDMVKSLAKDAIGKDEEGYRAEFLRIVKEAELLKK